MTNVKRIVNDLLDNAELTTRQIETFCGYPDTIESFPLVCWYEDGQTELEFSDNQPNANNCEIEVHIFTKKLSGYLTTNEIASILYTIFRNADFVCFNNREVADPENEVEHRILNYRKEFLF